MCNRHLPDASKIEEIHTIEISALARNFCTAFFLCSLSEGSAGAEEDGWSCWEAR